MNTKIKAKINLFAVLRNIQDLCEIDPVSQEIIKKENVKVQFIVPEVGKGTLVFKDGHCTFIKGDTNAGLKLWFTSPEHFNKLVDGEKTIPLFINIFKAGFLLNTFTKLAERLSYYLKPTDELLANADYFRINTYLTAYTAFNALAEIGNNDKKGKAVMKKMPDGDIQLEVKDGPSMVISVANKTMTAKMGRTDNPRAIMSFGSLQVANDVLNGKKEVFACLGSGLFFIRGYIPMLDNMNKLLSMVSFYLK